MTATDRRALRYAVVIALGGFLFGFDAAVISGVVGFVTPLFDLDDWTIGLVVGAPTLGAIIASLTAGPITDQAGRKPVMLALALLYTISAALSALAPDAMTLVVARFIGGLAFGTLMIAPMYIAELSPARLRGRMVSVNQFNIVIGFSAAYFANFFLLRASAAPSAWAGAIGLDEHAWRWMLGIETVPAAVFLAALLFVPESPRWLAMHGREAEAREILARIAPADRIERKLAEIRGCAHAAAESLGRRLGRLFRPELRLVLSLGIILAVAQQISGINSVYFYAPTIFEQSGVGTDAAFAQATYIGVTNVLFTVLAMLTVDRFGRRPLLMFGLAGVVLSMSVAAWGFAQAKYELSDAAVATLGEHFDTEGLDRLAGVRFDSDVEFKRSVAAIVGEATLRAHESEIIRNAVRMNPRIVLAGLLGFVASFAFSLGPVYWVLFSEIFPNAIRGICMSVMGVINSGVSFGVQFLLPWELSNLGAATTFFLYGAAALLFLGLVARLLPETRGRSLEALEYELCGSPPVQGSARSSTTLDVENR